MTDAPECADLVNAVRVERAVVGESGALVNVGAGAARTAKGLVPGAADALGLTGS